MSTAERTSARSRSPISRRGCQLMWLQEAYIMELWGERPYIKRTRLLSPQSRSKKNSLLSFYFLALMSSLSFSVFAWTLRLWSTWDLKPVREIIFPKSNKPIVRYAVHAHHACYTLQVFVRLPYVFYLLGYKTGFGVEGFCITLAHSPDSPVMSCLASSGSDFPLEKYPPTPWITVVDVYPDNSCCLVLLSAHVISTLIQITLLFVFSLTFSCDGHHLYTTNSEGTVIAWCRRDQQRMKLPMFYSFLSTYAAGWKSAP